MHERPHQDTTAATRPAPTERVAVPGGSIDVRVTGEGPPVVFVHGAFINGHLWDATVAAAQDRHRFVAIQPDLPLGAHARPLGDGADRTVDGIVAILLAVLDQLGIERATFVGNDSGGAITQRLVAAHPDRVEAVLLTSCDAYDNFPPAFFGPLIKLLTIRPTLWLTCQSIRFAWARRLPFTFGHLFRRRLTAAEAGELFGPLWRSAGARRDLLGVGRDMRPELTHQAAERFGEIDVPVDIAWTAGDRVFPAADADRLAAAFPNGRRVDDVTDAGSLSPIDQPGQVGDRLVALLERVRS